MDLFTNTSLIFDIIAVVILVISTVGYSKKGLMSLIVQLGGTILSAIGAFFISKTTAPWIYENVFRENFEKSFVKSIESSSNIDINAFANDLLGFLPETMREGILNQILGDFQQTVDMTTLDMARAILEQIVQPVFVSFLTLIVFFGSFVIFRFLVGLLANLLVAVNVLPIIGDVNRVLGWVLGFVAALFDLMLILIVVWVVLQLSGDAIPFLTEKGLSDSFVYGLFRELPIISTLDFNA